MAKGKDNIGIIAGGGPAPGINAVISAATIEAVNSGKNVIGIIDGFRWIALGDITKVKHLTINNTSRIHTQGGSIIGISRDNPFADEKTLKNTINSINRLGIKYLLTIGGDGTMYLAGRLEKEMKGKLKVAHLPKTIDNNLPLPDNNSTFGFETAKHIGTEIVSYLMEDAKTTKRWFLVVTMGRKTGHLAMGIGKSAGTTLTLIPEEFKEKKLPVRKIIKIMEGSIIKRLNEGREYGVAIIAEGITDKIDKNDIAKVSDLKKDAMGRTRYSEFKLAPYLKHELDKSLNEKGINLTIVDKRIGYELRSAPPIPFDLCYTRDLGYSAVKYLLDGGSGALISISNGRMSPLKFESLQNKKTGATNIRYVDINTESFEVAQKYMIKLSQNDIDDPKLLRELAKLSGMKKNDFLEYFKEVIK